METKLGALLTAKFDAIKSERDALKAENEKLRGLVKRIQDALGTGEEGDNLVAVARDAHAAEMELYARIRADREADELFGKLEAAK